MWQFVWWIQLWKDKRLTIRITQQILVSLDRNLHVFLPFVALCHWWAVLRLCKTCVKTPKPDVQMRKEKSHESLHEVSNLCKGESQGRLQKRSASLLFWSALFWTPPLTASRFYYPTCGNQVVAYNGSVSVRTSTSLGDQPFLVRWTVGSASLKHKQKTDTGFSTSMSL